jgi:flagellar biosynthesis repressor protein FlbT
MLKITLKDGEKMVVNGAVLRASGRTTLWLESEAAILRGREVMKPDEADTPARRLYFSCMMAYLDPDHLDKHHHDIVMLLGDLIGALSAPAAVAACAAVAREVAQGHHYRALTECRALIEHESHLLHIAPHAQAS